MKIILDNISKKYNKDYVFSNINAELTLNNKYAIVGKNGSGKTTLLKVISGFITPTDGKVSFYENEKLIARNNIHENISIAAPYIELIEEYKLIDFLKFHSSFKPFIKDFSFEDIAKIVQLEKNLNKPISEFSSGMKQRLKLVLAFCNDNKIVLLDEPTTNLDEQGVEIYKYLINNFTKNKIIVISSNNVKSEIECCNLIINLNKSHD